MFGWVSLKFECPEASEVMLSLPESYWLRGWSAWVIITLGLPGLLAVSGENLPFEERRPRYAGFVIGRQGAGRWGEPPSLATGGERGK